MKHLPLLAGLAVCALAGCQGSSESFTEAERLSTADLAYDVADGAATAPVAADLTPASPPSETALPAEPAAAAPSAENRRHLRRSADLRLGVTDVEATLRQARALATRFGGLVAGEDGQASDGYAETRLTLRVPSERFEAALDALAALGDVRQRAVSVDDVTASVVDLEARLRARRAAEARLVALVAETRGIDEMLAVQSRLESARADIESMEASARALRGSVALSTIRLTVASAGTTGTAARAADGLAAGWHGLLAVLIGVLPLWPLALVAGAAYAVWRRLHPAPAA